MPALDLLRRWNAPFQVLRVNAWVLFDPSPVIWLNSAGISLVIGIALKLSVCGSAGTDRWQTFRLFLMPFCVSSFATLIKGQAYVLVFPSNPRILGLSLLACTVFFSTCMLLRLAARNTNRPCTTRGA
jgi:hypothetical protein